MYLFSDGSRKPRKTTSSSTGAPTAVTASSASSVSVGAAAEAGLKSPAISSAVPRPLCSSYQPIRFSR